MFHPPKAPLLIALAMFVIYQPCTAGPNDDRKVKQTVQGFIVVRGQGVRETSRQTWVPELTLITAILNSGGISGGGPREVFIIRDGKRITILLRQLLERAVPDIPLKPGDVIEVPQGAF